MRPYTALTIAGSDPSGGAGIQADLRTFLALDTMGLSCITALTVQNSQGVQTVHLTPPDILTAQLKAILSDTHPDAVKIGMLGGADQVRAVADALSAFKLNNCVLDPVLASTGGVPLLDTLGRQLLLNELMPLCSVITPNLDEAAILTDVPIDHPDFVKQASARLLDLGARAVLIKGGHAKDAPIDYLTIANEEPIDYVSQRIGTTNTHGTGCLFSSAIAAFLAHGQTLQVAVGNAKSVMTDALQNSINIGQGRGYPNPRFAWYDISMKHSERLSKLRGIYVLTDSELRPDRVPEQIVQAALAGGAHIIQLRDKTLETRDLIALAQKLRVMAHEHNALFIVNDRVDVALASDADGVHLGPDDMHPSDARAILGQERLIGVSVSTLEEAATISEYASYLGVGAIYGSQTKLDAGAPVGISRIAAIKTAFPALPIVAIGGITETNINEVIEAGADAAAVISAVINSPDMSEATQKLHARYLTSVR